MTKIRQRTIAAIAVGAACLAGAVGISSAATQRSGTTGDPSSSGATGTEGARHNSDETALSGATLKRASDAAIAANAGATVERASTEDPEEGDGAAYEVHITKADGTRAKVLEDSSFKVLSTKTDMGRGHGGHGYGPDGDGPGWGPGGNRDETALSGSELAKATTAAKSAVPGATVEHASAEDPAENSGAAYEVHAEKADGSDVTVLLDKDFKVLKTVTDTHGPRGG